MKLILTHQEVREAIRQYVTARGFELAIPKTVNQNTGLWFMWDATRPKNRLTVEVDIKVVK